MICDSCIYNGWKTVYNGKVMKKLCVSLHEFVENRTCCVDYKQRIIRQYDFKGTNKAYWLEKGNQI